MSAADLVSGFLCIGMNWSSCYFLNMGMIHSSGNPFYLLSLATFPERPRLISFWPCRFNTAENGRESRERQ